MCFIDLEPCELWRETEVTARKPHVCSACRGMIAPKTNYWKHFSVFEGSCTRGKLCAACKEDRQAFADAHDGMLCDPGYFPDMLQDCIGDDENDEESARWQAMLNRMDARKASSVS